MTRERRLDWAAGLVVLGVYAVVQLLLLQGPRIYDPETYFNAGRDFPDLFASRWTLRLGLVLPIHAAIRVFGESEAALYAVPFASGLLLAGASYAAMLLLFRDRLLAAAAALAIVLNGYFLLNSSSIFPDTTATATFTAALACLVAGRTRPANGRRFSPETVALVVAGVLFGWTLLVRELDIVLVPALAVAAFLLGYRARKLALLAAAALATVALDPLYGVLRFGDPIKHVRAIATRNNTVQPKNFERFDRFHEQMHDILDTVLAFPNLLLRWPGGWVFILFVAIFVLALGLFRDRRLWLLAVWCFGFWAFMAVVGVGELPSGKWILNITNIRYWYAIFPPLVMGAFGALALVGWKGPLAARLGISLVHVAAVALLVLAVVPGVVEYDRCSSLDETQNVWVSEPVERWRELRGWFATPQADAFDVVKTGWVTSSFVTVFAKTTFGGRLWDGDVKGSRTLLTFRPGSRLGRTLVIVDKDRAAARQLSKLRRDWRPVFVTQDGKLGVLAHASAATSAASSGRWSWELGDRKADAAEAAHCSIKGL